MYCVHDDSSFMAEKAGQAFSNYLQWNLRMYWPYVVEPSATEGSIHTPLGETSSF